MKKINKEEYLTLKQISVKYGICLNTLYQWKYKELFPYAVIAKRCFVKKSDFNKFIKNKQKPVFHNKKVRGK